MIFIGATCCLKVLRGSAQVTTVITGQMMCPALFGPIVSFFFFVSLLYIGCIHCFKGMERCREGSDKENELEG